MKLQRIINYICHVEQRIMYLCEEQGLDLEYKNLFLLPHLPKVTGRSHLIVVVRKLLSHLNPWNPEFKGASRQMGLAIAKLVCQIVNRWMKRLAGNKVTKISLPMTTYFIMFLNGLTLTGSEFRRLGAATKKVLVTIDCNIFRSISFLYTGISVLLVE